MKITFVSINKKVDLTKAYSTPDDSFYYRLMNVIVGYPIPNGVFLLTLIYQMMVVGLYGFPFLFVQIYQ